MFFTSDNGGPAAPEILAAVVAANTGNAMPYGNDPVMDIVRDQIRTLFEAPDAAVYLVGTGTAANSLALASMVQPWQTIYCHRLSHIQEDECGAPEFYSGGAKLTLLDGDDAKISPDSFQNAIDATGRVGVHNVQKGALSITTASELGGVYTLNEIRTLCDIAKSNDIPVHMDGARFANALVSLGCSPAEMTWKSGVETLSLGGTKNGLMGVEAVVLFNPKRAWEFELRRKRGGHLFSKHRYFSAQMNAYFDNGLWLELAQKANKAAQRLKAGLRQTEGATILHPVDANTVFASWPRKGHIAAVNSGAAYYHWPKTHPMEGPPDESFAARLVCNWATTDTEIDQFVKAVSQGIDL